MEEEIREKEEELDEMREIVHYKEKRIGHYESRLSIDADQLSKFP